MIKMSHAGDLGDIVYACCTMKAFAEHAGDTIEFNLYPSEKTRVRASEQSFDNLRRFLEHQSYISKVVFNDKATGVRLDSWRDRPFYKGTNLCMAHLNSQNLPIWHMLNSWLTGKLRDTDYKHPVIFARSERYLNDYFPWKEIYDKYKDHAIFIGSLMEHINFCEQVGSIDRARTVDMFDVMTWIHSARLFVGNQSMPYAIAEGLKVPTIQETCLYAPDCVFPRADAMYVTNFLSTLPEV